MEWNKQEFLLNIRDADSDDLLDRVTAFRAGMEPEAVELILAELHARGVTPFEIAQRADEYRERCLYYPDGTAKKCAHCRKPAVTESWGWHWLWGRIPLLPRWMCYCSDHEPTGSAGREA